MPKLSWFVYCERNGRIEKHDIFENGYWEFEARAILNETNTFDEWNEKFRIRLMAQYWSRCEYELLLVEWPTTISVAALEKMTEEVESYIKDYGHLPYRVNAQLPKSTVKIDIYNQLLLNWDIFTHYVWDYITEGDR